MNLADPFGLKVCFVGTRAVQDSLRQATEVATGTTIEVDQSGCVTKVTSADGSSELSMLGRRLAAMAAAPDEDWGVMRLSGTSAAVGGRRRGYAIIGDADGSYQTRPWGHCDGMRKRFDMPQLIAHELLGHLYHTRDGGSDRGLVSEMAAVIAENAYLRSRNASAERCTYY